MNNETPTTKRFPRSLSEAFPAERANAIEYYKRPSHLKTMFLAAMFAVGLAALVMLMICLILSMQ